MGLQHWRVFGPRRTLRTWTCRLISFGLGTLSMPSLHWLCLGFLCFWIRKLWIASIPCLIPLRRLCSRCFLLLLVQFLVWFSWCSQTTAMELVTLQVLILHRPPSLPPRPRLQSKNLASDESVSLHYMFVYIRFLVLKVWNMFDDPFSQLL